MNDEYKYQKATLTELDLRWNKNIEDNIGDERWVAWKTTVIENHKANKLVKLMEQYAKDNGYTTSIIGVEPKETRNLAIYLHWGYDTFDKLVITDPKEDEGLILYYSKKL